MNDWFFCNFRWLKKSSANLEDRTNFFRESLKNSFRRRFFWPAVRRRRPKLTGAPPPTPWRRRTALVGRGAMQWSTFNISNQSINQTIGLTCKLSSVRMTLMHRNMAGTSSWKHGEICGFAQRGVWQWAGSGLGTVTFQLEGQHRVSCSNLVEL